MQVTPELQQWLDTQRQAGFGDEALLKALVAAGYSEDFSIGFLRGSFDSPTGSSDRSAITVDRPSGANTVEVALATDQTATGLQSDASSAAVPGLSNELSRFSSGRGFFDAVQGSALNLPTLFNTDNIRRAHDVDVRILIQLALPRVVLFEGLLSDAECDELIELARPGLASSLTVDRNSGDSVQHEARVSHGMFFQRAENPLVALLETRISALLGFPEINGEGLQILHYHPGGRYDPHQDYFDPAEAGSHVHLARGGQRIGTLILYLNTPAAGGGTVFPTAGLTVSAVKGHALFFSYPQAHAASGCLHGGNPVIRGEKWIATKWIRQSAFV